MNNRYIKLHVISNPFVSGGSNSLGGSIVNSLEDAQDEENTVPSVAFMKEYFQNTSLNSLFANGTNLFFTENTPGKIGLDIIGPTGSLTKDVNPVKAYDSLIFDPTDFHLSSLSFMYIRTNALKYVSVDGAMENPNTIVPRLNFVSNDNIRVTQQLTETQRNISFQLQRYNDIYGVDEDIVITSDFPAITLHKLLWDSEVNIQRIELDIPYQCYRYVGDAELISVIHFQILYDWIEADLPYRFQIEIYTVLDGVRTDIYSESVGVTHMLAVIKSYTNTIMMRLQKNTEIHFDIKHNVGFPLKIYKSSYLFTEYIV